MFRKIEPTSTREIKEGMEGLKKLEKRDLQLLSIVLGILVALVIFTALMQIYSEPVDGGWDKYTNNVLLIGFVALSLLFCVYIIIAKISIKRLRYKLMFAEIRAQKLKEVDELKTEFVSNVSHELRTPLASIKGFVSTLLDIEVSEDNRKKFLTIVDQESDRLNQLIEDLLDLSLIESGKMQFNFEPVNISEIMGKLKPEISEKIKKKGLSFKTEDLDSLPMVRADKNALLQIFVNLVSNAVKFIEKGGIWIRAEQWNGGKYIKIYVRDTGIGIEEKHLEKIFEKFYRVETTIHAIPGTGLGLAIVKDLVEKHKGKVWVESEVGKGSTFYFTIPVFAEEEKKNG